MSSLTFDEVQKLFTTLGVRNFGAALPEGRIHWTDAEGRVVAHARCQAVLSYAATNRSIAWAEALPHFQKAGVPCLPAPDEGPTYQDNIDIAEAQELATQAAQLTGAQFLYAAPTGGGGQLFLAIRDFRPGAPEADPEGDARRVSATRGWASARLQALSTLLGNGERAELPALLQALAGEARQQAGFVVMGTPLADQLHGLAAQAELWAAQVGEQAERVAYEMGIASRGFTDGGPSDS